MNKILVPLDGSKLSEKILTHIETLAQRTNAEIIMLQIVPFFWPSVSLQDNFENNEISLYLQGYN